MIPQAELALRGRNPDVLSCIASLSNDEVFTPPVLANQMLDLLENAWGETHRGVSIWADPTLRFLDPCTKSGVFLREITRRLTEGLKGEIPDLDERVDHILTHQVFGIGLTQLTSLLARRSLYCSKHARGEHSIAKSLLTDAGNIWFERTEHTWVDQGCSYCPVNRRDYDRGEARETYAYAFTHTDNLRSWLDGAFGGPMQFDVIVGNPPYQLGQSGGEAVGGLAMPIYQDFVRAARSLDPRYLVMVTPSRWFAGGRGLDEFRAEMLADHRIRSLVDFPDASQAFPGTQIKGGVSYFLWDRSWDGPCEVSTVDAGQVVSEPTPRYLGAYDVVVRRNEAVPILEKVLKISRREKVGNLASLVSPIQPFGLRTNFRGAPTPGRLKDPVRLIGNGGDSFISRSAIPRNAVWVEDWKVLLAQAYGAGESYPHQIYNRPFVAEPGTACTATYLIAGRFTNQREARRFAAYLRTKFVRFLVSLRKNTQSLYSERFSFVPNLPLEHEWTDAALYEKFKLSKAEIDLVESLIRPLDDAHG